MRKLKLKRIKNRDYTNNQMDIVPRYIYRTNRKISQSKAKVYKVVILNLSNCHKKIKTLYNNRPYEKLTTNLESNRILEIQYIPNEMEIKIDIKIGYFKLVTTTIILFSHNSQSKKI